MCGVAGMRSRHVSARMRVYAAVRFLVADSVHIYVVMQLHAPQLCVGAGCGTSARRIANSSLLRTCQVCRLTHEVARCLRAQDHVER